MSDVSGIQVTFSRSIGEDFNSYGLGFNYGRQFSIALKRSEPIPIFSDGRKEKIMAEKVQSFLGTRNLSVENSSPLTNLEIIKVSHLVRYGNSLGQDMTVDKFKTKLMQDPNDIEACQVLAVALFVKGEEAQARRILEKAQTLHEDRGNAEEAVQIKHTLDPLQPNI